MLESELKLLIIKENLKESLIDCFSCSRSWSGWSYETMSQDDFHHLPEDEDLITELAESMLPLYDDKDSDKTLDVFGYVEIYYNNNIENQFYIDAFHDDFMEYIDVEMLVSHLKKDEISLSDCKKIIKTSDTDNGLLDYNGGFKLGVKLLKGDATVEEIENKYSDLYGERLQDVSNGLKDALACVEKYGINKIVKQKRHPMKNI